MMFSELIIVCREGCLWDLESITRVVKIAAMVVVVVIEIPSSSMTGSMISWLSEGSIS